MIHYDSFPLSYRDNVPYQKQKNFEWMFRRLEMDVILEFSSSNILCESLRLRKI